MPNRTLVTDHYTHGGLVEALREGIRRLGKNTNTVDIDDLGPVDEFHIGGRGATESFLDQLEIDAGLHVLDIGCGLGGASRFAADRYGCQVTGIDLTPEYVETGNVMCSWVGLGDRINLAVEDATALSLQDGTFDRAFMLHVGMNIADKESLAREIYRVVKPGGRIGIYDVMRVGDGDLTFPVPWADQTRGSWVATPETYKSALAGAGFSMISQRDRREFALDFFAEMRSRAASTGGPPPLGLHILMGETAPLKINNMIENISRGRVAPVEIIAHKPG